MLLHITGYYNECKTKKSTAIMITRYKLEMVEAGKYDDGEWVSYTDYCELEAELYKALRQIEELEDTIREYAEAQPPI